MGRGDQSMEGAMGLRAARSGCMFVHIGRPLLRYVELCSHKRQCVSLTVVVQNPSAKSDTVRTNCPQLEWSMRRYRRGLKSL